MCKPRKTIKFHEIDSYDSWDFLDSKSPVPRSFEHSQVVSGNRSPCPFSFGQAMVGLSKASRPSLTMAYLSITLAATCVVLSLAFRLQVGGPPVCWHLEDV